MYPYISDNSDKNTKNISAAQKYVFDTKRIAELIESATENKYKAADTYKKIADNTSDSEQEAVVRSIYNEEIKNIELLKELYTDITGSNFDNTDTEFNIELDFGNMSEIFKTMCKAEIESAGFFRDMAEITKDMPGNFSETLLVIMNDEQNHSVLDSLMFTECIFNENKEW